MNFPIKSKYFSYVCVNKLDTYQDITDEYVTRLDIEFILKEKQEFKIFDDNYAVKSVRIANCWGLGDETCLVYTIINSNGKERITYDITVSKILQKEVFKLIVNEEEKKTGWLKGYILSEDPIFFDF